MSSKNRKQSDLCNPCAFPPSFPPIPGPPRPTETQTFTTGPLWRNPDTDIVVVTLLNEDFNESQMVTVSVLNWQNTCNPTEFGKFAFLCGELIDPATVLNSTQVLQADENMFFPAGPTPVIIVPPDVPPIITPFTFTIPPRKLLTIHAYPPSPMLPPNPCYEVLITFPPVSLRRVIVNTFGINVMGVPQEGNTVLHNQFPPQPFLPPSPF